MTLNPEMRKDLTRWLLPRLIFPLIMAVVALGLILVESVDTSHQIERDTIRSELSDIDNRIQHERCLIRPFNAIIRREPTTPARDVANLCDPDHAIPDLQARRDKLEQRLRDMGAFEVRQ